MVEDWCFSCLWASNSERGGLSCPLYRVDIGDRGVGLSLESRRLAKVDWDSFSAYSDWILALQAVWSQFGAVPRF